MYHGGWLAIPFCSKGLHEKAERKKKEAAETYAVTQHH